MIVLETDFFDSKILESIVKLKLTVKIFNVNKQFE